MSHSRIRIRSGHSSPDDSRGTVHVGVAVKLTLLIALLSILILTLGGISTPAQAAETAKLDVSFSPDRLGATTTINLHLDIGTTDGSVPSPITSFDTQLPPQLELIASTLGLAICQPTALLAEGLTGCSPNAQLGSGSATVEVPFGPETVRETASVVPLMGPPVNEQIGVLLFAESKAPVFAQLVFPGTILLNEGSQETLTTDIPLTPTLPGAADASATEMQLSIGPDHLTYYKKVHGRSVGFRPQGVQLPLTCRGEGFRFISNLRFADGTTLTTSSIAPCPPPLHKRHGTRGGS